MNPDENQPTLAPDRLRAMWARIESGEMTDMELWEQEQAVLAEYAETWAGAMRTNGADLELSLLSETADYFGITVDEARTEAFDTRSKLAEAWREDVDDKDASSVDDFYDTGHARLYIHSLMWWHNLREDNSPLGYVTAAEFARNAGCRDVLDFGSGVGSGCLLFDAMGMNATAADISSPMLEFIRWRFDRRGRPVQTIDLRREPLPTDAYDFVAAMDVFEHLPDPVATVDQLAEAIRPGGYLFGRFAVDDDDSHPLHIVHDFEPVFERLAQRGFTLAWKDTWLWGHHAYQLT